MSLEYSSNEKSTTFDSRYTCRTYADNNNGIDRFYLDEPPFFEDNCGIDQFFLDEPRYVDNYENCDINPLISEEPLLKRKKLFFNISKSTDYFFL